MGTLFTVIVTIVVVGILLAVVAALVEMSPFGHHLEQFRDRSGRPVGPSPHL
ncbi:MAG TPA: hypothetical protein VN770_02645 [Gaiellaceae bacterium]|nr:hypothetical protein [Gaiellaceae bacterium]